MSWYCDYNGGYEARNCRLAEAVIVQFLIGPSLSLEPHEVVSLLCTMHLVLTCHIECCPL